MEDGDSAYEMLCGCEEGTDKCSGGAVDARAGVLQTMSCRERRNLFYFQRQMQIGGQDSILTFFFSFQVSNVYLFDIDIHIKLLRLSFSPSVNVCIRSDL